jgi:hypothetical protein
MNNHGAAWRDGFGPGAKLQHNQLRLISYAGRHVYQAVGGSSPQVDPRVAVATLNGARNTASSFITINVRYAKRVSKRTRTEPPTAACTICS